MAIKAFNSPSYNLQGPGYSHISSFVLDKSTMKVMLAYKIVQRESFMLIDHSEFGVFSLYWKILFVKPTSERKKTLFHRILSILSF